MNEVKQKTAAVIDLPGEVWKDIEGYEGMYAISNMGRVKSLKRKVKCVGNSSRTISEKIIAIHPFGPDRCAYCVVVLSKNGSQKTFAVHRLVALAFLPAVNGKYCVNHKDLDKTNNRVDNLEWVSHADNSKHAKLNGMYIGVSKKNRKEVRNIETGESFVSAIEAAKKYNVAYVSLQRALHNPRAMCCGCHWTYS